ncbi:uncharacterized protein PGTG_21853 [Puccinia graminis f. sp. tritici CRL 75-36-700-3]|uniref:Septin-type G domain-containing protein n=1 Tax=Puccinia graminis f. sp. tritici (strain CRL 75-36-700-3 / race SCCL) TaxID=418459 RepID=H6QSR8_PUCGT|nr:uncharacterized protein PGTG_21853 [Puccinia graminis f. sp. tritici CRL 75-36-700-3]EHS63809.1 hypothetical protein PGTG_21853 [Puccinia graminis f. sp. tritici CRL 75-36-700-3]
MLNGHRRLQSKVPLREAGVHLRLKVAGTPGYGDFINNAELKLVEIEFMKCLHTKVNLILVIAIADTMTDDEITAFKQQRKIPFAIVGLDSEVQTADGRKCRGHQYPGGIIKVDNEEHCRTAKVSEVATKSTAVIAILLHVYL